MEELKKKLNILKDSLEKEIASFEKENNVVVLLSLDNIGMAINSNHPKLQ